MSAADTALEALAEGFAQQVERWARAQAADAAAVATLRRAACELSFATGRGHVCLRLAELHALLAAAAGQAEDVAALRRQLLGSGAVGTPQRPGAMPLILDDEDRLYLHRHFDYERRLAQRLTQAALAPPLAADAALRDRLDRLFGRRAGVDWQKIAAALALRQRLLVISGGPGTGKTTTVVKLLACLLEQQPLARIALAAPTGKAAARLGEAVRERALHLPSPLRERLPTEAHTVHRLLGTHPRGFLHDAQHPLALDVLVVDEASMLDLALATRLLQAVPETARVVLLGDKDQLAAVEAGAVFAELSVDARLGAVCSAELAALCGVPVADLRVGGAQQASPLRDTVVWFTQNFRFGADSGIALAAQDIRLGNAAGLIDKLRGGALADVQWLDEGDMLPGAATWRSIDEGFGGYLAAVRRDASDLSAVTAAFERFRVLCAHREGPRGVLALNDRLAREARAQLATWPASGSAAASPWFAGRPVMVLRNDPLLALFNGDIGIALPDAAGELMVHFPQPGGGFRAVAPLRLPAHETAFAMTVHKSQGSEFDEVLVLLPEQPSRVLTRELLYTAVTRARRRVRLAGSASVLQSAIELPTRRHSGLLARLREAGLGQEPAA